MIDIRKDRGSFRDPRGSVYIARDHVYRTVMPRAATDFDAVRSTAAWEELLRKQWVLPEDKVDPEVLGDTGKGAIYVLEHPKLPYISYPYEWSFPLLKAAALLHLDVHLLALKDNVTLTDASAYNIQFQGPNPVFIDHLSFRPYHQGEFWIGHRQFCEQFLNPLLLRSVLGVPANNWYRGAQEGVDVSEINRLIPWRKKLSWKMLSHVSLQARFQQASIDNSKKNNVIGKRKLPKEAFIQMLSSLRSWILKMEPADTGKTVWVDYAETHSYTDQEVAVKKQFVHDFVHAGIRTVWDIGCNTGDYTKVVIRAGVDRVIGFDADQKALELAYERACSNELPFLPLFLDAANPSPMQGWAETERMGFSDRSSPDAIIALALVHHLAIGRNIPLDQVVSWLVGLSRSGIIEFIPKNDAMVQKLLCLREDVFDDYNEDYFLKSLQSRARITRTKVVSASGRRLVCYER